MVFEGEKRLEMVHFPLLWFPVYFVLGEQLGKWSNHAEAAWMCTPVARQQVNEICQWFPVVYGGFLKLGY